MDEMKATFNKTASTPIFTRHWKRIVIAVQNGELEGKLTCVHEESIHDKTIHAQN